MCTSFLSFPFFPAFLFTSSATANVREPVLVRNDFHQELCTRDYSRHRWGKRPWILYCKTTEQWEKVHRNIVLLATCHKVFLCTFLPESNMCSQPFRISALKQMVAKSQPVSSHSIHVKLLYRSGTTSQWLSLFSDGQPFWTMAEHFSSTLLLQR